MRIAILGTRGIPNHYGGFEQYAELLSAFLVAQGWEVLVYNSSDHPYKEDEYKGVKIKHIHDPESKMGTVGQFVYDFKCIMDTRKQKFDMVYQLGYTSSAVFNFLFPRKTTIVTNMDGLEWKRTKYNKWVQKFLKFSEWLVVKMSDHLVADSLGIQSYLEKKYKVQPFYSAYTATIPASFDLSLLSPFDLTAQNYDLLIARMEPENNIEMIIEGHLQSGTDKKLIVIGGIHAGYGQYLFRKYNSLQVQFRGAIYDIHVLDSLRRYSRVYFHGHSVGGTNPSLLEAMSCSCNIVAHHNEFNRGVLQENAMYFEDVDSLQAIIRAVPKLSDFYATAAHNNKLRITNFYAEHTVFTQLKERLAAWEAEKK